MFHKFLVFIGSFLVTATSSPALPTTTPITPSEPFVTTTLVDTTKVTQQRSCPKPIIQEKIVYRDAPEKIVYRDAQCNNSTLIAQNNSLNDSVAKGNDAMQKAVDYITILKSDNAKCNALLSQTMGQLSQFSDAVTRYQKLSEQWKSMYYTAIGQANSN